MEIKLNFIILLIVIGVCSSHAERICEQKCREYGQAVFKKQVIPAPLPGGEPTIVYNINCQHEEVPLIYGGVKAAKHEFPHQAVLGYKHFFTRETKWLCGGSLISPQFILSAAHCHQPPNMSRVKYIKVGINKKSENSRIFNVEEIYANTNYNGSNFDNDIMILKLADEIEINEFILPICLPTKQHKNENAIVSGFGATEYLGSSNDLLKVAVERFTYDECGKAGLGAINGDFKLCYGHHTLNKDSCSGDSGGPLQIYNNVNIPCTYTQIGIVSYGPKKCGTAGFPGLYTNVYHYLDWIENIVWRDSTNSSSSEE